MKNSHIKMNESDESVGKSQIPTCNILGVNVAAINMKWLLNYLEKNIKILSGEYICVSNVHTTVMAHEDKDYCVVQNNAVMAIPDGGPLSTIAKSRGFNSVERIAGPSLMDEIFKVSAKKEYRHFFFGSTQNTLDLLRDNLDRAYPGIQIVGMYSPPFRPLTDEEDKKIIKEIHMLRPDFVWVGLGAPKQENWMSNHQGKIQGLMIGVGAGFDYFAGNIKRAPIWMQKCNLEWFYRLLQDPKRLFKRYLYTNTKFIWNVYIKGK